MRYAKLGSELTAWQRCDVTWKVGCALVPTQVCARERKIPSTEISVGSTHTKEDGVCSFSISSFRATIRLNRGGQVIFSMVFTNQVLFWGSAVSRRGLDWSCSSIWLAVLSLGCVLCTCLPWTKMYTGRFADVSERHLAALEIYDDTGF
jgi:hypothetical protein